MLRALLTGLTITLVASCAGPGPFSAPRPLTPEERARLEAELEPFLPAFESLESALEAGDDGLARRVLDRLLARGPTGAALERARGFERIVEGREWVRGLSFRLEPVFDPTDGRWALRLCAKNDGADDLELQGAPPTLRVSLLGVAPNGVEQRFSTSAPMTDLARWSLPAHAETRAELGRFEVPVGEALAVRALFELEFLPTEVLRGSERRPASRLPAARGEVVRLAAFLPKAPVEPEELVRYVRAGRLRTPPLLERTVRIAPEQRGRALDLLTPVVLELPSGEVEKLGVALRWLTGVAELGSDPRAWRQWLDRRAHVAGRADGSDSGAAAALELPTDRP